MLTVLWDTKVHYLVHNSPHLIAILSQINAVHAFQSHLVKIHFTIIFLSLCHLSCLFPCFGFPHQKSVCISILTHTRHISHQSYLPWFYNANNTGLFKMTVGVLTTYHTQYTWYSSICFYLIEQHSKFLLHNLQVIYMCHLYDSTNNNMIIDNHHWHVTNSLERTRLSCWCL